MRIAALAALPTLSVLLLAGCASSDSNSAAGADDAAVRIVASTNVYGDIASEIGGPDVSVTSIIDSPNQDPHSFEGSARVQLELSRADIVIVNGGGYDDWATTLLEGADNADARVLNVTELSGYSTEGEFNEHLWYDMPTMQTLTEALGSAITEAEPDLADTVTDRAADVATMLDGLAEREADLASRVNGAGVAITEPVPLYLLEASGFVNVTPAEFSEAIEEGNDVPPLALQETEKLFTDGTATMLVYNEQTTSAETEQVLAAAKAAGVPVVPVTETEPADTSYGDWMGSTLDALEAAL
jgi:zinc/manganese transport system substrate-binding protein